jgi:hypothetical protein
VTVTASSHPTVTTRGLSSTEEDTEGCAYAAGVRALGGQLGRRAEAAPEAEAGVDVAVGLSTALGGAVDASAVAVGTLDRSTTEPVGAHAEMSRELVTTNTVARMPGSY